jgi:hypothetical protein
MSKKKTKFSAFGVQYQTEQFSAIRGMELMAVPDDIHPCDMLSQTSVKLPGCSWASLDSQDAINAYVVDVAEVLAPRLVLNALLSLVGDFNFKFMEGWKAVKVPARFADGATTVTSKNVDPMASQLIQDGVATLKELEDYYSLEDAFKMFDTIMVKGINNALSHEASLKKSKQ